MTEVAFEVAATEAASAVEVTAAAAASVEVTAVVVASVAASAVVSPLLALDERMYRNVNVNSVRIPRRTGAGR